jgi:hypothetical protein
MLNLKSSILTTESTDPEKPSADHSESLPARQRIHHCRQRRCSAGMTRSAGFSRDPLRDGAICKPGRFSISLRLSIRLFRHIVGCYSRLFIANQDLEKPQGLNGDPCATLAAVFLLRWLSYVPVASIRQRFAPRFSRSAGRLFAEYHACSFSQSWASATAHSYSWLV